MLGGQSSGGSTHGRQGSSRAARPPLPDPFLRPSNGLDQFFAALNDRAGLTILDFAGASQENISFITSMGHRLSSEDFVRSIEHTFGSEAPSEAQSDPVRIDQFVGENL